MTAQEIALYAMLTFLAVVFLSVYIGGIRSAGIPPWRRLADRMLLRITRHRPMREIQPSDQPYIERYWMGRIGNQEFVIHRYHGGDQERHLHDHPFKAWCLVLAGDYREQVLDALDGHTGWHCHLRTVRWVNRLTLGKFHRVMDVAPGTWTLMIYEIPRVKNWGFLEWDQRAKRVYYRMHDGTTPPDWFLRAPSRYQIENGWPDATALSMKIR